MSKRNSKKNRKKRELQKKLKLQQNIEEKTSEMEETILEEEEIVENLDTFTEESSQNVQTIGLVPNKNTVYVFENGELIEGDIEALASKMDDYKHKCGKCANCLGSMCDKVHDEIKKRIDRYPFILDGYQIFDNEGKVDKFIVNECKNFEMDNAKKRMEEFEAIKKKRTLEELTYSVRPSQTYIERVRNKSLEDNGFSRKRFK